MAIRPKTQIGTINCSSCSELVPVKRTETGTLNFSCPWCDLPAYAKQGTKAHENIMLKMKPMAAAVAAAVATIVTPAPAPAAPTPVPAKPAPAATRKTVFG